MKQMFRLNFMAVLVSVLGTVQMQQSLAQNMDYDFSSPEKVFRTCGMAIKNNDPATYYRATYIGKSLTYEQFLSHIWKADEKTGKRHYLIYSVAVQESGRISNYFQEAKFLREEVSRKVDGGALRVFLLKWPTGKVVRKESFVYFEKDGFWRWVLDPYLSQDTPCLDSYATPTDAFRAIGQAQFLRLETEVCRGLAMVARGGMDLNKCAEVFRSRMTKSLSPLEVNSMLTACTDCLEEEMFTEKDGSRRCRVWETEKDATGKRVRRHSELFIKEDNEWKWLPDPKSIWYLAPSKKTAKPAPVDAVE